MDIVQERLEREYDMDLITTAPTVDLPDACRATARVVEIENPSKLPDLSRVEEIREPIITTTILMPQEYVGPVITLVHRAARRAEEHAVPRPAGDADLRAAAGRSGRWISSTG